MADTITSVKLVVRPRMVLTDINMIKNEILFDMIVAPLAEGGDKIAYRWICDVTI